MQQVFERGKYAIALAIFLCSMVVLAIPRTALAAGETINAPASSTITYGNATPISVQIDGTGNDSVSIRLYVSHGSLSITNTGGLTLPSGTSGSPLYISGTRSNVNTALATLKMTSTTMGSDTLEMSLTGAGEIYFPETGHLYEVVSSTGTWNAANTAASGRTKYGASGYLATMTSAEENEFVADRLTSAGWFGASDAVLEDDWKWVVGPEAGTSFWAGGPTGSAVSDRYENWANGEPNNAGNEDCAQFLSGGSGEWNDLPCGTTTLPAYVVEYGAPGQLPAVANDTMTITVTGSTRQVSSCADLQTIDNIANSIFDNFVLTDDIDCGGIPNFAPLGSDGTAWSEFSGTFDGDGHTISNLTINDPNNSAGLFQRLDGAKVQDLTFDGGSVTAVGDYAGSLAGHVEGSILLYNVSSNLTVTGDGDVGGIIGFGDFSQGTDSLMYNVHYTGEATGQSSVGGIIGNVLLQDDSELSVTKASSTGSVVSFSRAGGLFGHVLVDSQGVGRAGLSLTDAYSSTTVEANDAAGGIIGLGETLLQSGSDDTYITLRRVYASGTVTVTSGGAAGLIGYLNDVNTAGEILTIEDSFSAATVTGPSRVYALVTGVNGGSFGSPGQIVINDVYVDRTRSGQASNSDITLSGVQVVNTANADQNYFFNTTSREPLDEWDFSSGNMWYMHGLTFPTFELIDDEDGDGAPSASEQGGPNNGDANDDGTADSLQGNVVAFVNGFTSKEIAIALDDECTLSNIAMRTESQFVVKDSGYDYPQGFTKFTANCGTPGFTTTVKLFYYDVSKDSQQNVRKYNTIRNAYFALPNSTVTQQTIGGRLVTVATYQITDGSELDEDGQANGIILDPAGLAQSVVGVPNTGLGGRAVQ